jgi:hypothetical protein
MIDVSNLLSKTVTIRSITGEEYLGRLSDVNVENGTITVLNPRVVVINDDQVVLLPFVLTANTEEVQLSMSNIFSVLETLTQTAIEYGTVVAQEYIRDMGMAQPSVQEVEAEPVTDK